MNNINKMKCIAAAVSLMGLTAANDAMAQDSRDSADAAYNASWYIAPSVNATDVDNKFGTENTATGFGLRFGKPVSQSVDIQFGGTYSGVRGGANHYRQDILGADALYLFSRSNFRPFVLLGGGAEYDRVNGSNRAIGRTAPFINAGLGVQYEFTDQLGMQVDVRRQYAYLRSGAFGFNRANSSMVTVGLTYAFDKSPAPAPVPAPTPTPVAETPAPAAAPVVAVAAEPARFEHYSLAATDLFNFDSAKLSDSQSKLDEIADVLNRNPQINDVVITGYTDRLGSAKYNKKLSQRRAEAVKDYLVSKHVDAGRLTAVGKGESNPLVKCTDKKRSVLIECLAPNRRVDVEQITVERRVN